MSHELPAGNSRLSRIDTLWSVVRRAHRSEPTAAREAQQQLLDLYGGAIRRYLLASLRDQDLADELFQSFAMKFVSGSFSNADPQRGRFRSFVKTVLYRMIAQHYRQQASRKEQSLAAGPVEAWQAEQEMEQEDETFLLSWREQILDRAWQALADHELTSGVPYHTILRLRTSEPTLSSDGLATQLSELLGKSMTPGATRVMLHRAREKFAHLLIDVTAESLPVKSAEEVEQELIDLRLKVYCRDVLSQRLLEKENDA